MKARERKRIATVARYAEKRKALGKLPATTKAWTSCRAMRRLCVCTTAIKLMVVLVDTCVSLALAAYVSAKWLSPVKFPA